MPGYTGSIAITGFIAPTDTQDTYPVLDPLFGIDGLRNVTANSDRNAIPNARRRAGMVVGVGASNYFKLLAPPWTGGDSDWSDFITVPTPGNVTRTQYIITAATVSIPANYQYLVYGGLLIGASGSLINNGQVIILNGTMSLISDGTYSGAGTLTYVTDLNKSTNGSYTMAQPSVKYSATFSSTASVTMIITHSLNTTDITYSVREANNFITANIEINDVNSIKLTTDATITNGRINIIG